MNDNVGMQVDIYSFGVVLWEIVTQEKGKRGHLRPTVVPDECPAEIEGLIDRYTFCPYDSLLADLSQHGMHAPHV